MADSKAQAKAGADDDAGARKKKMILIGAVAAVVLLGGGIGAGFLLSGGGKDEDAEKKAAAEAEAAHPVALYASLGEKFVVALTGADGSTHYLQTEVSVLAREQPAIDEVGVHAPLIRARLLTLLGSQEFQSLRTDEGRQALRGKVLETVQQTLQAETGKPGVEQVFFTEFVLR